MNIRAALVSVLLGFAGALTAAHAATTFAIVTPDRQVELPRDHGAHPDHRTEWWYVTGWLETESGETLGFQVTFFRTKPDLASGNPSAFTPRQLIIGHAALSDPKHGKLWKDQRIARAVLGLAGTQTEETRVWLDRWSLQRNGDRYVTTIQTDDFSLDLALDVTQPPMLNGRGGYSQKGPAPESASYYYSLPHLKVSGQIDREGVRHNVRGTAWLDHEWSSAYLDEDATGWDWLGVNLDDGGALMLFRIRDGAGAQRWGGGTWRKPDGTQRVFLPDEIEFTPLTQWTSPRTAIRYPVRWRVRAADLLVDIDPLMNDQESDSRLSTGAIYWEGAVTVKRDGRRIGRGYLELTGYGDRLRLP